MRLRSPLSSALFLTLLAACSSGKDDTGTGDNAGDTAVALDPVCEDATEPTCIDNMILDLSLHDDKVSDGEVTNTTDGEDFVTAIDASAGGYNESANNPWIYVRFDADGAHRVDIDDETALEDMSWDLALHRFIIRQNSGDSGPSCVGSAAMLGYTYDELVTLPDGLEYQQDNFYTADCTIVNDSSGLPGSPQVAIYGWWEYPGCLAMTATPFLVQKQDGHVFKMVVESYYDDGQQDCNDNGSTTGNGGFFTIRWKMMN